MPRKLCDVDDTFQISGLGLLTIPGPPFNTFGSDGRFHECSVQVKRPDGTTLVTRGQFYISHFSPPEAMRRYMEAGNYTSLLPDLKKSEVPVGSEIFEVEAG
jgi:hypothetical protein